MFDVIGQAIGRVTLGEIAAGVVGFFTMLFSGCEGLVLP